MTDSNSSKEQILLAMLPLQQETARLLFAAEAHKRTGDLQAAANIYEQLVSVCRNHIALAEMNNRLYPESPFEIRPIVNPLLDALLTQADLCELLGDRRRAEAQREEAMRLSDQYLLQTDVSERQRQRANTLIGQGRFNEALTTLAEARDVLQAHGNVVDVANVTIDIASILEWLGDYERALKEAQTVRSKIKPLVSEKAPSLLDALNAAVADHFQEAQQQTTLVRISLELEQVEARCNRYLGNLAEAERRFLDIMPRVPSEGRVGIEYQIAAILVTAGKYKEGLTYLDRIEPMFKGIARYKLGAYLSLKAESLLGLGHTQQALDTLAVAIPEIIHHRDIDVLWRAYERQARALVVLGKPAEALSAYGTAAETINGLRKAPLGYRLDSTYLRDKMPVFAGAINLACDQGDADACCRFMEMIKSRGLTATLSIRRGEQPTGTSALDRQVDELSREIDALDFARYQTRSPAEIEQIEKRRDDRLTERAAILERIRIADPRWRSLSEPVLFDLKQVLDLLAARKQAALSLFFRSGQVVAVLLMDGRCTAAQTHLSDRVQAALTTYQTNLQKKKPEIEWFDPATLGLEVGDLVPQPLLQYAISAKSLVVVPHGPLHLLPWAGLRHEGRPLFDHCPVGIVPNLSCLQSLATMFSPTPKVALLGAPDYSHLPNVKELTYGPAELDTVEDVYQMRGGVIALPRKGRTATEAAFWELAKHADAAGGILHMSCHGSFETGEPMHSGLLLTDGKVDAAEIARTSLPYDEVVLSACHTGHRPTEVSGVLLTGDDVLGLPGAFLEAGVRSVLVSIPPAREDVTLRFMKLYHENRAEGLLPLAALQSTQKDMLSDSLYGSSPHLWIGFTVYGYQ